MGGGFHPSAVAAAAGGGAGSSRCSGGGGWSLEHPLQRRGLELGASVTAAGFGAWNIRYSGGGWSLETWEKLIFLVKTLTRVADPDSDSNLTVYRDA